MALYKFGYYYFYYCVSVSLYVHLTQKYLLTSDNSRQWTRGATDVLGATAAILRRLLFRYSDVGHQGRAGQLQHDRVSVCTQLGHEISRDLAQVSPDLLFLLPYTLYQTFSNIDSLQQADNNASRKLN